MKEHSHFGPGTDEPVKPARTRENTVQDAAGKPPRSFDDFERDYARAFS
jgi:hypothetical protein